jgi:hypothetical protein
MHTLVSLAQITLLLGCGPDAPDTLLTPRNTLLSAHSNGHWSEWSEPVNLGPVVNSPFIETGAELSPDELSLYFNADRPGGLGGRDQWVSRRACHDCPWQAPVHLGPNLNSPQTDGTPAFSPDGHLLFFTSSRAGGQGGEDIWVSRRTNTKDDLGWGPPVNLGPGLNTPSNETSPAFLAGRGVSGHHTLYFVRWATALTEFDIYQASVTRNGEPLGPAVAVAELNHPSLLDSDPTIRGDGRELLFWSTRPGGEGDLDIWVATRCSVRDPWSTPQSLGPPVNTSFGGESVPALSRDGRTLVFSGNMLRGGSFGRMDLWMSTRTRVTDGHHDDNCGDDGREDDVVR